MSAQKVFVQVPQDITLELDTDRTTDPPRTETRTFNFVRFFLPYLLDHETTFGTRSGILESADIEGAFKGKKYPDVVPLARSHFDKLKKAYTDQKYPGTIWRHLTPFFAALDNASEKDPRGAAAPDDEPKEQDQPS